MICRPGIGQKSEGICMDKTNLINAMHDVLLNYCITTLRTKKAALAGHKDDFTAFDYGAYVGAKSMAVTVLEHIYSQEETRKFLDRIYEEASKQAEANRILGESIRQYPESMEQKWVEAIEKTSNQVMYESDTKGDDK